MKIKTVVIALFLLTICPLLLMMLLPTPVEHSWQIGTVQWMSQHLKIESTATGQLEYFSFFVKSYLTLLCPFWAVLLIYLIVKDESDEMPKPSQFKPLDAVIVFTFFCFCIGFAITVSLWHLNPSLVSIRVKNSLLFRILYEYKLGVILAELFYFAILLIALLGLLGFISAVIINIHQRFFKK
jgi:hypothetical protein